MYAEIDYPQIPTDSRSIVVTFSNLLLRFDIPYEPVALYELLTRDDPIIDWWSLAEYIEGVEIFEVNQESGWPTSTDAIVRFNRIDESAAGVVDHYCLVADANLHSIIDSIDGVIKSGSNYEEPVGWASYISEPDYHIEDDELVSSNVAPAGPDRTYTVLKGGESLWQIARKLKIDATELIEHNDITTPTHLSAGTVLHLPIVREIKEAKVITYELLDSVTPMHVSKPGGTRKQGFGNIKRWTDVESTGPIYAENQNVTIVAIAHVPIAEGDGEVEAAYYMDSIALGEYEDTGKVAYTIGFNHSHLSPGRVEEVKVSKPVEESKIAETIQKAAEALAAPIPPPAPPPEPPLVDPYPNKWKSTFVPFPNGPVTYLYKEDMVVHDIDQRRQSKQKYKLHDVDIAGTFVGPDDVVYGRPVGAVQPGYWYGVPMDALDLERPVYNTDIPLAERKAMKQNKMAPQLTAMENYWYIPFSQAVAHYTKLTRRINKNKKKESNNGHTDTNINNPK